MTSRTEVRCLSCGYVVELPHVCHPSTDSVGIEIERACMHVRSPLTGRDYVACFVTREWHGLQAESATMTGETVE